MNRLLNGQKCGNERCGHPFNGHYTTYDNKQGGCSFRIDEQREQYSCPCKGFALVHLWRPGNDAPNPASGCPEGLER